MPCVRSPIPSLALAVAFGLAILAPAGAQAPPVDGAAPPPAPSFAYLTTPPLGMPPMPTPPGGAPTVAMFDLGRDLFADPVLSRDRTVSCATCHPAATAFASPEPRPAGVDGRRARRHAPALLNRGWGQRMRWDGSTASLDAFVLQPIADPMEMDLPLDAALRRLRDDPLWRARFAAAFDDGVTEPNLARALATFVRGIAAGDAPIDRFHAGDARALSASQRTGLWLFESKAGCWRCHPAPLFTDERMHNTGVGARDGAPEAGLAAHTGDAADTGRFKTPTLRGIGRSAPFMHDGSLPGLEDVVRFYARGGEANPHLDAAVGPLRLDEAEQRHLVEFLRTL
ncbi:MAG: cytochrome-c peroxidase [Planctomycetota bacterium]